MEPVRSDDRGADLTDSKARPERLETRRMLEGLVFEVDRDRVLMPSGRQVEVDVIRHPPSVVIIPVPEPGCIILVRQFRYPINRLLWELPAGSVDAGETIEAAARRECHEEIGQVPETLVRLGSMFPTPGYSDEEMFFFRASSLVVPAEAAELDEDEDLEVHTFTLADVRHMVRSGEITDMKTVIGVSLLGS
jgi:ADP-ribose pyrophosphatase